MHPSFVNSYQARVRGKPISIPDDLAERDQWVLWRYVGQGVESKKIPFQIDGHAASSTNPRSWSTMEEVTAVLERDPSYAGLGFVFSPDDPFCGIDLDDCIEADGTLKPWAQGIVERFADSYAEISPSGRGLKVWVRGSVPRGVQGLLADGGRIEVYDRRRYFTFTGDAFRGAPLEVADHAIDVQRLYEHLTERASNKEAWPSRPSDSGHIPRGSRHNTLVSFAGTFRARRICDEAIEAALQIINSQQCEEPLPAEEISRIVRSTRGWNIR